MNADKFFPVPYNNRNETKMRMVRRYLGGYAGYGRWVALLGMLYDQDGLIDMSNEMMRIEVCDDLELDDADAFFTELARIGLIDSELYHELNHVVNKGVCDQLEYKRTKSEAGKKGSEKRWKKAAKGTC